MFRGCHFFGMQVNHNLTAVNRSVANDAFWPKLGTCWRRFASNDQCYDMSLLHKISPYPGVVAMTTTGARCESGSVREPVWRERLRKGQVLTTPVSKDEQRVRCRAKERNYEKFASTVRPRARV